MRWKVAIVLALLATLSLSMPSSVYSQGPKRPHGFNWRPPGYTWTMPPRADRITVSLADASGMATVTGSAGAVPANMYVMVKNVSTGDYGTTQADSAGAFTATVFAPEDTSVQVSYTDRPFCPPGCLLASLFQGEPSTQVYVDNLPNGGPQNVAYTLSGLFASFSSNGYFIANGTLNDTQFSPGSTINTTVNLRMLVTPGLVYNFNDLQIIVMLQLERLFDTEGYQHGTRRRTLASTLLAPTGLPIFGGSADVSNLAQITINSDAISRTGNLLETSFVLNPTLPANLPPGIYRPMILFSFGVIAFAPPVITIQRDSLSTSQNQGATPYLPVFRVGNPASPRLTWMLLANTLHNGSRGTIALQDRGYFEFAPFIGFQARDFIIPQIDPATGERISYRLEPFMPLIDTSGKGTLGFPNLPLVYPGGSLTVRVQHPDGKVDTLGPATIQQSLDSLRMSTEWGGAYMVFANPGPGYVHEVTTLDDRFNYKFSDYGRHVITMTGTISDIWGNQYTGGGTYEVFVARTLDLDLGTMPGTPFEVGNTFSPTVIVEPNVPAQIEITLRQYNGATGALSMTRTISGRANNAGYFHPLNAVPITFSQAGEYVVDVRATYTDADGVLWMGSDRGASVIETPGTPLVGHGGRGLSNVFDPYLEDLQWYFLKDLSEGIENGDLAKMAHIFMPYQSGDIYWFVDPVDAQDVIHQGVISEKPKLTVHDTVGEIAKIIQEFGNDRGEMYLRSKAVPPYNSGNFPEFMYLWAYGYSASQRPGVQVRTHLMETIAWSYWNSDDPYDLVIGNGIIGDLPGDFKFQYGGAVIRYLGNLSDPSDDFAEYAIYASGAVMVPRGTGIGNRITPPFRGSSGGPDGGPLFTLKGKDIDIFFHPTGVRPGSMLETGDVLSVAGAVMPPMGSLVTVTVDSPSGRLVNFSQHANKIGYFYNPSYDVQVTQPGVYTVTVQVVHDGLTSTGLPPVSNNRGDVLNTVGGAFNVYVIPQAATPPCLDVPHSSVINPATIQAATLPITGSLPPEMTNATVNYTVRSQDLMMASGTLAVNANRFTYAYDPITLHKDFRNLDIFDQEGKPTAVDSVTISFFANGRDANNQPMYRGRSLMLQGDLLLADTFAGTNGLVELGTGSFRPGTIAITQGESVTWLNCGDGARQVNGSGWSSGTIPSKGSASRVFDSPGTFTYSDAANPGINGTIIVTRANTKIYLPLILKQPSTGAAPIDLSKGIYLPIILR